MRRATRGDGYRTIRQPASRITPFAALLAGTGPAPPGAGPALRTDVSARWRRAYSTRCLCGLAGSLVLVLIAVHIPAWDGSGPDRWLRVVPFERVSVQYLEALPTVHEERRVDDDEGEPVAETLPAPRRAGREVAADVLPTAASYPPAERFRSDLAGQRDAEALASRGTPQAMRARSPAQMQRSSAPQVSSAVVLLPVSYVPPVTVDNPPELRWIDARYPLSARRARAEGRVIVKFRVEPDGRAYNIRIVKSLHPALDEEAIRAIRYAYFRPARHHGRRVTAASWLAIRFRLTGRF